MFDFIKKKLAQKEIASLALKHSREAAFLNFDTIKSVFLISYIDTVEQVKTLKQVAAKFKEHNKEVTLAVFYPKKELTNEMLVENGVHFLCLKDTNWIGLPKVEMVPFLDHASFDMVIDLSQKSMLPTTWLAYKSEALLIASRSLEDAFADFTIKIPSHKDETFLAEQIIFYLRTIKSK